MSESRLDQMRSQCADFHKEHPLVWDLFVKFTFDRINKGFQHYSVNGIFERIRWETAENSPSSVKFKLNNNYRPFYARRFMKMYPEHDGFFRTRIQTSGDNDPSTLPELGPADYE